MLSVAEAVGDDGEPSLDSRAKLERDTLGNRVSRGVRPAVTAAGRSIGDGLSERRVDKLTGEPVASMY